MEPAAGQPSLQILIECSSMMQLEKESSENNQTWKLKTSVNQMTNMH